MSIWCCFVKALDSISWLLSCERAHGAAQVSLNDEELLARRHAALCDIRTAAAVAAFKMNSNAKTNYGSVFVALDSILAASVPSIEATQRSPAWQAQSSSLREALRRRRREKNEKRDQLSVPHDAQPPLASPSEEEGQLLRWLLEDAPSQFAAETQAALRCLRRHAHLPPAPVEASAQPAPAPAVHNSLSSFSCVGSEQPKSADARAASLDRSHSFAKSAGPGFQTALTELKKRRLEGHPEAQLAEMEINEQRQFRPRDTREHNDATGAAVQQSREADQVLERYSVRPSSRASCKCCRLSALRRKNCECIHSTRCACSGALGWRSQRRPSALGFEHAPCGGASWTTSRQTVGQKNWISRNRLRKMAPRQHRGS